MISTIQQQFTEFTKNQSVYILKRTLLIFTPIITVIIIFAIINLRMQAQLEMQLYKDSENSVVDTKLKNIEREIYNIISDIFILKLNSPISHLWEKDNMLTITDISYDILNLVKFQQSYDQVRIIDSSGDELIRINYNEGKPIIVPNKQLQNKKNRYYFTETFELSKNEVFISPFDLNFENNQIELPLKPMIRFATPLFNKNDEKSGILVFNYFGQVILNQLNSYINKIIEDQLMLVNGDGYWLKGPSPEMEWGFMFKDRTEISFKNSYKNEWDIISLNESAQFETSNGLFTFKTIYLVGKNILGKYQNEEYNISPNSNTRKWKLVSYVPHNTLYAEQIKRRNYVVAGILIFALGLLFVSWQLAVYQYKIKKTLLSLQISNNTKDKFFTIIAHDLKGPFNALLGFSNILVGEIESGDDSNVKTYSLILKDTINNTYNFLINLLDWSRSQTNKIEFKPEKFDLNLLVEDIKGILDLQAKNKQISITNNIPENQTVFADKNMINTIIRNFVSNAVKYTKHYGKVEITSRLENNILLCSVADNGVGMSEEVLSELINFGDTISTPGTENEKGTGLGLLLCNELIKKHEGKIGIESKEGKGSTFYFEIPQK